MRNQFSLSFQINLGPASLKDSKVSKAEEEIKKKSMEKSRKLREL